MYDPLFKMSFQDKDNNYYTATLNQDASWSIALSTVKTYIEVLPDGWSDTSITWARDMNYLGVFRSMSSNGTYKFSMDGRAIIQYIRSLQGVQGYALFTIWMWNEDTFTYDTFYQSELDFKTYHDYFQDEILEISTLDNGLIRQVHAYGNTKFNIPIWQNTGGDTWITDANFVLHDGIKLLYNASYISTATTDNILDYSQLSGNGLRGFNDGSHGTGVDEGVHTIPFMSPYNVVQNNGTTTFIGNTILAAQLLQGNQGAGAESLINEVVFAGVNHSQPYSKENYSLKSLLPQGDITMSVSVAGQFAINEGGAINITTHVIASGAGLKLSFVLFEISEDDNPAGEPGLYTCTHLYDIPLLPDTVNVPANGGAFSTYPGGISGEPVDVTFKNNKVYVFAMIWDNDAHLYQADVVGFKLSDLRFSIFSKYDSGVSGIPIAAPMLNPSVFPAFRPYQLLEKIVPLLNTTETDGYGFPIANDSPYSGHSDYLSDPAAALVGDGRPYQVMLTSAYCIHDLQGQSYITMSLNQLTDYLKKSWGCAATIQGNTFRVEPFTYFFDKATMILDLGYDVAEMEDMEMTDGLGANMKLGYTKADTNSNFGVDPFCTELYFNTPLSNFPGVMDYEESGVLCEQYAIELIRVQKVNQPIGTSYDPASPSGDNQVVALYTLPETTVILPDAPDYDFQPYDPSNNPVPVSAYQLTQRNGVNLPVAQNSTPTDNNYVFGMYYPDTAVNLELSPGRSRQRVGGLIHSFMDNMEGDKLTFRNTSVMQYNNKVLALSGIESNLSGGDNVVKEFRDIDIADLGQKLFLPHPKKVKSKYPINMYQIFNSNPNGYVRWYWKGKGFETKEYHAFISKAVQSAGSSAATDFIMWPTPDEYGVGKVI